MERCAKCEMPIDEGIGIITVIYAQGHQQKGGAGLHQTYHFCSDLCLWPWADSARNEFMERRRAELLKDIREEVRRIMEGEDV